MQTVHLTFDGKIFPTREIAHQYEVDQFQEWLDSKPFIDVQYVLAQLSIFSPADWDGCTLSDREVFRKLLFEAWLSGKMGVNCA